MPSNQAEPYSPGKMHAAPFRLNDSVNCKSDQINTPPHTHTKKKTHQDNGRPTLSHQQKDCWEIPPSWMITSVHSADRDSHDHNSSLNMPEQTEVTAAEWLMKWHSHPFIPFTSSFYRMFTIPLLENCQGKKKNSAKIFVPCYSKTDL